MSTDYKISKFLLNLVTEIQSNTNKHSNQKLELNSHTLNYLESHLTSSTISSKQTAPIRKIKKGVVIFGKIVFINETLKNGQIRIMPSNTIITV